MTTDLSMLIRDRVPVSAEGIVVKNNDPKRLGRIRVLIPDLGVNEESGWILRSALAHDHRTPKRGSHVRLTGYLSGNSLTLFYIGVIHTLGKGESPGRGLVVNDQEYADSVFMDFGSTEDEPNVGVLLYYNAKDKTFIIKTKGGSSTQIKFDDETDTLTLIPGDDDIQIGEASDGRRVAMVGDSVQVDGIPGTITSGSVPMKADFPR